MPPSEYSTHQAPPPGQPAPKKRMHWLLIAQQQDPSLQGRVQTAEQEVSTADRVRVQREVQRWKAVKE